jgi:hypothetical protein
MAFRQNINLRNVIADAIDVEFSGGTLNIYTGTQPASAGTAATGTLLASITLPSPAFGIAASGAIAKSGTWTDTVDVSGTAGYGRFVSAVSDRRFDVAVVAEITFDNAALVAGGTVTVTACTITIASGE